ncbi:MAG: DUF4382 domain-containing protein [Patescibacteria group bacterium]
MGYKTQRGAMNKKLGLGILALLLVIGIPLAVSSALKQTNWFNQASGPSDQAMINLNSASEILSTVNTDGTMGPRTSYGNWSNSLPVFLKGKLVFAVTDPIQGQRPTESFRTQPTQVLPSQAQDNGRAGQTTPGQKGQENGPQAITALNLTITKVEVHIAYQGNPGSQANTTPGGQGRPSASPSQQGRAVDHWETLTITSPTTLDLVALANTNDFPTLGITSLAEGRYTEVRLYVSGATATITDGTTVDTEILGRDNIVRVVQPFTITAGQTTSLTMDFDAQHSVIKAGDRYLLKPVVARLIVEKP